MLVLFLHMGKDLLANIIRVMGLWLIELSLSGIRSAPMSDLARIIRGSSAVSLSTESPGLKL